MLSLAGGPNAVADPQWNAAFIRSGALNRLAAFKFFMRRTMFGFGSWRKTPKRRYRRWALALGLTLLLPALAWGQSRVWTTETVDTSGTATSLAVDHDGNVHI